MQPSGGRAEQASSKHSIRGGCENTKKDDGILKIETTPLTCRFSESSLSKY